MCGFVVEIVLCDVCGELCVVDKSGNCGFDFGYWGWEDWDFFDIDIWSFVGWYGCFF